MSSSAQIVTRALKRLNLVAAGEDPSASEAADGLAALNAMLAGWQADGINVNPDVPLPAKHEEGVIALLAVRLAPDYGRTPQPQVLVDANTGMARLEGDYISAPLSQFDTALVQMPSKGFALIPGVDVTTWAVSTAYAEFDRREANRKVYECIVAGTSNSTGNGPHSTGDEITDGTVTWRFIGYAN